ncbi:MAG: sulfite exporter TauE/SafE family protein [Dehalococcoidia bacterium]|nr:sulfite exporter TauE/SafE family protein [Dehalococcoidia bacterium]
MLSAYLTDKDSMGLWAFINLVVFGLAVGAYGTLVGLGGGFVIVPVMLLVFHTTPQEAAGTSLAVVFFNALSGSFSYIRQKRVDFKSGIKFALATVPGAIIGAQVSTYLSSNIFSLIFGLLMLTVSVLLIWKPEARRSQIAYTQEAPAKGRVTRRLIDGAGTVFVYSFNERTGIAISFFVGFLSSILGIGGGIVHVPALIHLFSFPAHIATATSHFILVISTGVGAASHLWLGQVLIGPAIAMAIGAVIGAQLGAALSRRLHGVLIVRLLSVALLATGIRLILSGLGA